MATTAVKYTNPFDPTQTWNPKRLKPKWLVQYLADGNDFTKLIVTPAEEPRVHVYWYWKKRYGVFVADCDAENQNPDYVRGVETAVHKINNGFSLWRGGYANPMFELGYMKTLEQARAKVLNIIETE